jgi:hypothetical protein
VWVALAKDSRKKLVIFGARCAEDEGFILFNLGNSPFFR